MLFYSKKESKLINQMKKAAAHILVCGFLCVNIVACMCGTPAGRAFYVPENEVMAAPKDAVWPEAPDVLAPAAILYEASTGTILYEKNSKEKMYPASTTKLMTSLIAIEQCPLSDMVEMTRDAIAIKDEGSHIGMYTGELLSLEDCLYGILLPSANEVTYAVAEHVAGSAKEFVKMMQARAEDLGCVNTHYANPHGLHDDNHYTCAYDLALVMNKCIEYTTFNRISHNHYYEIPPTNLEESSRVVAQTHQILRKKITYDGVFAGKTGHTDEAGQCLVTACERDGMTLICVVLNEAEQADCYTDTINLFDYGYNNFILYNATSTTQGEKINAFPVIFKDEDAFVYEVSSALSISDSTVVLPVDGDFADVENRCELTPLIKLSKGDNIIGRANFYYAGVSIGSTNIVYSSEKEEIIDAATVYFEENEGKESFDQVEYDRLRGIEPEMEPEPEKDLRPIIISCLIGGLIFIVGLVAYIAAYRKKSRR